MNAKSDKPRRKKTAEKPPKDRRGITERAVWLYDENQEVAVVYRWFV